MLNCPVCGSEIKEVPAGVSKKTGREYSAFQVCSNSSCGWKPSKENGVKKVLVESHLPSKVPQQEGNGLKERAMIMAYAKDLVVAQINMGVFSGQASKETICIFRELWNEYLNPNEKL